MRPNPWPVQDMATLWIEYGTDRGVTGSGKPIKARIGGRRAKPNLHDYLETAAAHNANKLMFVGKVPDTVLGQAHWTLASTPGWTAEQVHPRTPSAQYLKTATGQNVYVRTAAEWFGEPRLTPGQARETWDVLGSVLRSLDERASLFLAPSATGRQLWALSLPKNVDPYLVAPDIAEEIHNNSGQHHFEHLVAGPNFSQHEDCIPLIDPAITPRIKRFAYVDGRFMYASLCRELGIGPGRRLKRIDAFDLINRDRYARARVLVRFKVPENWDHVGLLGVKMPNERDGWYYPNRPGATGETWADLSEVFVAQDKNWLIDPLEAVVFDKARVMDTFADRITRAREKVAGTLDMPALMRGAVTAALRAIMLQAIGAFASRGPDHSVKVESARDVPPEYQSTATRYGGEYVYTVPGQLTEKNRQWYHPEISAQVWGRGRAKVLEAPGANGNKGGALAVPASSLIGINGDAIYTTTLPRWSLPERYGGGDDGRVGKLRLKGLLEGDMLIPATITARDLLRKKAEKAGTLAAFPDLDDEDA